MKRSNRLVLVLGPMLALVAFDGILAFGASKGSATPAPVQRVTVVTAALDLALRTPVSEDDRATIQMALDDAIDTYREPEQLTGLVLRRHVKAGEAFTSGDVAPAGALLEADLVANLALGQRAMAIEGNELSGVGSLMHAGDRVDVMLSLTERDETFPAAVVDTTWRQSDGGPDPTVSLDDFADATTVKLPVQNVQVLATTLPTATQDGATDPDTGEFIIAERLVVLGVSPQAELIRFARSDRNLSLLLRSPQDAATAEIRTTGITLRQLVDEHGVLPPRVVISQFP